MRVTYIHQHFKTPNEPGGTRPYQFARRLAAAGDEVTMICAGEGRRTYRIAGFTVEQLDVSYDNTMPVSRRLRSFASFMLRSTVLAARRPTDIVLASSTPLTVVVPGIAASLMQRAPLVVEIRDLWPQVPIALGRLPKVLHLPAKLLERVGYAWAAHVIALSPSMAARVQAVAPSVPVTVIPNSADFAEVQATGAARDHFGVAPDETLLLYAGSLGEIYDPAWLADLALALHGTTWRLLVVGAGAGLEPAKRRLQSGGLDPDTVFVGPRARTEVVNLLAESDIVVSSIIDNEHLLGSSLNKVFDAMAVGRPVACNHGGWLRDLLADQDAVVDLPRTPTNEHLMQVVAAWPPRRLIRAGQRAAEVGRHHFDRDMHARTMRTIMRNAGRLSASSAPHELRPSAPAKP